MDPADLMSPIGCHYYFGDGQWEVTLFASNTEIVGGVKDGSLRVSRFCVNLKKVVGLFSEVHELTWQSHSLAKDDELGAHLSLEGTYAGEPVWLRILAAPPKRFKVGRQAQVYQAGWEEVW